MLRWIRHKHSADLAYRHRTASTRPAEHDLTAAAELEIRIKLRDIDVTVFSRRVNERIVTGRDGETWQRIFRWNRQVVGKMIPAEVYRDRRVVPGFDPVTTVAIYIQRRSRVVRLWRGAYSPRLRR